MVEINTPEIGQVVLSSESFVYDTDGNQKYSLLSCDGASVSESTRPLLYATLPDEGDGVDRHIYTTASPVTNTPYKIVGEII